MAVSPGMFSTLRAVPVNYWLLAIRPKTLPASVAPILLGSALAFSDGRFVGWIFVVSLLCALLLQIGVNLANDFFDFIHGHDTPDRLGPKRVSQQGLITAEQLKQALVVVVVLAVISGGSLIWAGGWPIFLLGVCSLLGVFAYSGGPKPLASNGLGDVAVFIFFGLIAVGGSYYLHVGDITWRVILLAASLGALNTAILVINNIRDRKTDRATGKLTLAVRIGRAASVNQYKILLTSAFLLPVSLWTVGSLPTLVLLAVLLCIPEARRLARRVTELDGVVLNHYLALTAQLTLWYSVLMSVSLILV